METDYYRNRLACILVFSLELDYSLAELFAVVAVGNLLHRLVVLVEQIFVLN